MPVGLGHKKRIKPLHLRRRWLNERDRPYAGRHRVVLYRLFSAVFPSPKQIPSIITTLCSRLHHG